MGRKGLEVTKVRFCGRGREVIWLVSGDTKQMTGRNA
jgi:hypothetical protein